MAKKTSKIPNGFLHDVVPTAETSVHCRIDAELYKEVKKLAIDFDMHLKQCINQALRAWVQLKKMQKGA